MQRLPPTSASVGAAQPTPAISKLVSTQILFLLETINPDKEKTKRDAKIDQILGMINEHGIEVFSNSFRRGLVLNADHIFNGNPTQQGSYDILLKYIQGIRTDPHEADRIAQSLDTTEGDLFKNFDVSAFLDHFKLDVISKTMLALSLRLSPKLDLRTKATAILTNQFQNLLLSILNPTMPNGDDLPLPYLETLLARLIHRLPPNMSEEKRMDLQFAVRSRFETLHVADLPLQITNLLALTELNLTDTGASSNILIKHLLNAGPRATESVKDAKEVFSHMNVLDPVTPQQIANILLYMLFSHPSLNQSQIQNTPSSLSTITAYNLSNFVTAMKEHPAGKRVDWQDVVLAFDRPSLTVNKPQFLSLYNALLPLANEYQNFDIQRLWGGSWNNEATQLAFVVAFVSCTPTELDTTTIPRLRQAYSMEQFSDAPEDIKKLAQEAVKHPFVSLDAVKALFDNIFYSEEKYNHAHSLGIPNLVINPHIELFVLAVGAIPRPWNTTQNKAFVQLFSPFLRRQWPGSAFVMYGLWKRDNWPLIGHFNDVYQNSPSDIDIIYQYAVEFDWVHILTSLRNEFGLEMAAKAHKHGRLNFREYLKSFIQPLPDHSNQSNNTLQSDQPNLSNQTNNTSYYTAALVRFLKAKADHQMKAQKDPVEALPNPLSLATVAEFLNFFYSPEEVLVSEETQLSLLGACIMSHPRLMNYRESVAIDEILESSCIKGHRLSEAADLAVQDRFSKLENNKITVSDMIEDLRRLKHSLNPADQDKFASFIHGLFGDYLGFDVYSIEALKIIAVLFGEIISSELISSWALQYALALTLDAVQNKSSTKDNMFCFGHQVLRKFTNRLSEWPEYCERLLQIDLLRSSEVCRIAQIVLQNAGQHESGDDMSQSSPQIVNGNEDDGFIHAAPAFSCIAPDPPSRNNDFYQDPSEEIQDKVQFVLNNVSLDNKSEKQKEIVKVIELKHFSWFAAYLVDQRAKVHGNLQSIYLSILDFFDHDMLWEEVTRETYKSLADLLNSSHLIDSIMEKSQLKNLSCWLGCITLARDKPIKATNLSIEDLLIEANATSRLAIAIPLVTKVLLEMGKSELFMPPNPWTSRLLSTLVEVYKHVDLKIQLRFDIEGLFQNLKLDMEKFPPSSVIRESTILNAPELDLPTMAPDQLELFPTMSQPRPHHGSFSAETLAQDVPEISKRLVYIPYSGNVLSSPQVRETFACAAQEAIKDIIFPVVERSVTIAAIAAANLAIKDFATELDEQKLRNATHQAVKQLARSLAQVTCREPLRMSMSAEVRKMFLKQGEKMPEGVILLFVNDNMEEVCRIIEEAAEKHSIAESESQIRVALEMREVHKTETPGQPFHWPQSVHSNYGLIISDPFKLASGGVNRDQAAIYENFGKNQIHLQQSRDGRPQLQDGIQEAYSNSSAIQIHSDVVPSQLNQRAAHLGAPVMSQSNGYGDHSVQERCRAAIEDLLRDLKDNEDNATDIATRKARIDECCDRILSLILLTPILHGQQDQVADHIADQVHSAMYQDVRSPTEIEVLANLLAKIFQVSTSAARSILILLSRLEDELLNPFVLVSLLRARILEVSRVDALLARALNAGSLIALDCVEELINFFLNTDYPLVIRANLALTFEAMVECLQKDSRLHKAEDMLSKLRLSNDAFISDSIGPSFQDELGHVFEEWVQLCRPNLSVKIAATFLRQLSVKQILDTTDRLNIFLRVCLNMCVTVSDAECLQMHSTESESHFSYVDALASLLVRMIFYQNDLSDDGEDEMETHKSKLFDGILSFVVVYMTSHWQERKEEANPKVFFRFFSSLLEEMSVAILPALPRPEDYYLPLAQALLCLQPSYLPGFTCQWLGLVSHRSFFPFMLSTDNDGGVEQYSQLLTLAYETCGTLVELLNSPDDIEMRNFAQQFYIGALRLTVVLWHDFPNFLAENYFQLCNSIPASLSQLRNLVLCAIPPDLPQQIAYPFQRLQFDNVDGAKVPPVFRTNVEAILRSDKLLLSLNSLFNPVEIPSSLAVSKYYQSIRALELSYKQNPKVEASRHNLIHAAVLYTGISFLRTFNGRETYIRDSPHATFLWHLCEVADFEDRVRVVESVINQLRYLNAHTVFFLQAILDIFSSNLSQLRQGSIDRSRESIQEIILRNILDRLSTQRPHPWGVVTAMIQLYRDPDYALLDLPSVTPEVERIFQSLKIN